MSIYFDFKTIDELAEENYNLYRQQRGAILDDDNLNGNTNRCFKRQINENKSKFKPDDWIRYIDPLVNYAMREGNQQGSTVKRAYQKYMLLGVLVGLGKTPQEAINQVQEWQTTGASQILKSTGNEISSGTTTGISGEMSTPGGISGSTGGITNAGTSGGLGGFGGGMINGNIGGMTPSGTGSSVGSGMGINGTFWGGTGTNNGFGGNTSAGGNFGNTSGRSGDGIEKNDRLVFD